MKDFADPYQHFDTNILAAIFDPIDRTLRGADRFSKLRLSKPLATAILCNNNTDILEVGIHTHVD